MKRWLNADKDPIDFNKSMEIANLYYHFRRGLEAHAKNYCDDFDARSYFELLYKYAFVTYGIGNCDVFPSKKLGTLLATLFRKLVPNKFTPFPTLDLWVTEVESFIENLISQDYYEDNREEWHYMDSVEIQPDDDNSITIDYEPPDGNGGYISDYNEFPEDESPEDDPFDQETIEIEEQKEKERKELQETNRLCDKAYHEYEKESDLNNNDCTDKFFGQFIE